MAMDHKTVVDKIQKLLRLAGGTDVEGEMKTALQKAHQMLEKYNLSMSDVQLKQEVNDMVTKEGGSFTRTYQWIWKIAKAIDTLCNTKSFRNGRGWSFRMYFCGTQTDVSTATSMFQFLFTTLQWMGQRAGYPGIKGRNSYLNGVGQRVWERAKEMTQTQEDTPDSERTTAIVHVKSQAVAKYAKETHNIQTIKTNTKSTDAFAYMRGLRDGNRVPLSTSKSLPE